MPYQLFPDGKKVTFSSKKVKECRLYFDQGDKKRFKTALIECTCWFDVKFEEMHPSYIRFGRERRTIDYIFTIYLNESMEMIKANTTRKSYQGKNFVQNYTKEAIKEFENRLSKELFEEIKECVIEKLKK